MPVRHEHRATAAGVRDYFGVRVFKSLNVLPREYARAFEITGMSMQGPATHLTRGRLHRAAIHFERTRRGLVDSLEKSLSDTTLKEQDRSARIPGILCGCFSIRGDGLRAVRMTPACL